MNQFMDQVLRNKFILGQVLWKKLIQLKTMLLTVFANINYGKILLHEKLYLQYVQFVSCISIVWLNCCVTDIL